MSCSCDAARSLLPDAIARIEEMEKMLAAEEHDHDRSLDSFGDEIDSLRAALIEACDGWHTWVTTMASRGSGYASVELARIAAIRAKAVKL